MVQGCWKGTSLGAAPEREALALLTWQAQVAAERLIEMTEWMSNALAIHGANAHCHNPTFHKGAGPGRALEDEPQVPHSASLCTHAGWAGWGEMDTDRKSGEASAQLRCSRSSITAVCTDVCAHVYLPVSTCMWVYSTPVHMYLLELTHALCVCCGWRCEFIERYKCDE